MQYRELDYTLPTITADAAAKQAILILEKVAEADDGCLLYVLQASNVLALAGLRAESPYNEFEPGFSQDKQALLANILHDNGYEILKERSPYYDITRNIFSIMCRQAIKDLPKRYPVLKSFWREPQKLHSSEDFAFWCDYMQISLVRLMEDNQLPKEWLMHWWAPHDIRFGMLLGYPGQAIASLCWSSAHYAKDETIDKELRPDFPYQGIYLGTHVDYDYNPALKDDPTINAHIVLWSEVLKQVYAVFTEARLQKIPQFQAEYTRYKKYDETV